MSLFERYFSHILSRIRIDEDALLAIRDATTAARERGSRIVYVKRRTSSLEAALLRRFCTAHGLPAPDGKEAELLFLRGRTGHELTIGGRLRQRSVVRSRIQRLVVNADNVCFIPVQILAGLGPRPLLRPLELPLDFRFLPFGDAWLAYVFWAQRNALRLDMGPVLKANTSSSASDILRRSTLELYRKEKVARGPAHKSTETVESIVLSGEEFEALLQESALETAASREQVYKAARRRFKEIAATMHGGAIRILYRILHPVIRAVFETVEVEGLERLREEVARRPTILLPSHKSHFDYILIAWILYHENLPLPYVAAGANLNFFPAGPLLKAAGGFFIRRSIGDDPLYKLILDRYLQYLVKRGHLVAFYIEGGRSRTGTVRPPRLGLLKYLVEGWEAGGREDVAVVPIGISYEKIAEEQALVSEQKGERKRPESMFQFLRLKGIRRSNFGSVMINIGEPLSLKRFYRDESAVQEERRIEDLGYAVSRSIMRCTAMTSTALAATSLLSFAAGEGEKAEALRRMQILLQVHGVLRQCGNAAKWDGATLLTEDEYEPTLECLQVGGFLRDALKGRRLTEAMELSLNRFLEVGYAERLQEQDGERIRIPEEQHLNAAYYKNTVIQFFAPAAVILQAAGSGEDETTEVLYRLHQLLKPAFLLPFWRVWREELAEYLRLFARVGWVQEGATFESFAFTFEGLNRLNFISNLLRPYLQGLLFVVEGLEQGETDEIAEAELLNNAGRKAAGESEPESRTPVMFSFAIEALLMHQVLKEQTGGAQRSRNRVFRLTKEKLGELSEIKAFLLRQLQTTEQQ